MPRIRIDRVDGLLVASDLHLRFLEPDFVVGPGPSSSLLARFMRPASGGTALDLGCGSGILSLLLAAQGAMVEGLDINLRAVGFARFNAALNELATVRAHYGDFLTEDTQDQPDAVFNTVVANPPFVLAPELRLVYRDRPLPGDEVGARTVERAARSLAPDGRGYVLCHWIDRGRGHWSDPVRRWIDACGTSAFLVRVLDQGPAEYAIAWNRYLTQADRDDVVRGWTRALQMEGVKRIHSGVIGIGRQAVGAHGRPRFAHVDVRDQPVSWRTVEEFLVA